MSSNESPLRTIAVAAAVALVCSMMVAASVRYFRPYQLAYEAVERNRVVLLAAAPSEQTRAAPDRDIVTRIQDFETLIADIEAGELVTHIDPLTYDFEEAPADESLMLPIPEDIDVAGIGAMPRYMPVYRPATGAGIVLPFFGSGMWSTITGYVGLAEDFSTVTGIEIYSHGETPGIGDRIENREWLAGWVGKRIYDEAGAFALRVGEPEAGTNAEHAIDGITGATVTVNAIERSLQFWLGPNGFAPLLATLRNED